jgi:sec-independent protein translocase protein TatA
MFGNLGFGELMVIMVIVLVLFGAKRIPEISASFGKGIREFQRNVSDIERSVTSPESTEAQPTRLPPPASDIDATSEARDRLAEEDSRREPKRLL